MKVGWRAAVAAVMPLAHAPVRSGVAQLWPNAWVLMTLARSALFENSSDRFCEWLAINSNTPGPRAILCG
jgi:hypothetical protein